MALFTPPPTSGCWELVTESSAYLLDLDQKTVLRIPSQGAGTVPGRSPAQVASLEGDNDVLPLVSLLVAEVGSPAVMFIQQGDRKQHRRTTVVRSLTRVR